MNRGEIWWVHLDPTVGAEMKKLRTAVIISNDAIGKLPLKVIVPITEWQDRYAGIPWMVRIKPDRFNNLDKESVADAFQIRSVAVERFANSQGKLSNDILEEIIEAIATVISDI